MTVGEVKSQGVVFVFIFSGYLTVVFTVEGNTQVMYLGNSARKRRFFFFHILICV